MSESPIDNFSLACPSGGDFYICQGNSTQFIGCCKSDPCADGAGTCAQADLEPATFNKLDYQGILAQDCSGDGDWYTCSSLATPFMGCCASNACTNTAGCPVKDLVAAELGNATQARYFLTTTAASAAVTTTTATTMATTKTSSSSTSSGSSSSSAATTTTTVAASSSTTAPVRDTATGGLSTGAKAGIGIGAVALLAVVGVLFFLVRRALLKRKGVVVRGSSPPSTPSMISYSPARQTYADPNQITFTPPTIAAPIRPSLPAHSPSSTFKTYSAGSSPSTGLLSRENSVRSTTTTPSSSNALGIRSVSPFLPHGYSSPAMDTLAELDGSEAYPSPPVSEMAADTPVSTSRPSASYRPYRPER